MPETIPLLEQIEAFLTTSGMSATTFGRKAVNDWGFVRRLREGGDVGSRMADRVRAFIAAAEKDRAA